MNRFCKNVCKPGCVWHSGWERRRDKEREGYVIGYILNQRELLFPCWRDKEGGKRAEVGGGVLKRRRVRWGRAHSVGSLSCGAQLGFNEQKTPPFGVRSAPVLDRCASCRSLWLNTSEADTERSCKGTRPKTFFIVVFNKGKMLFCFSFSLQTGSMHAQWWRRWGDAWLVLSWCSFICCLSSQQVTGKCNELL